MSNYSYREEVLDWISQDPDIETKQELHDLHLLAEKNDTKAIQEITKRFHTRLSFGTAGLRGELGAGPNRMNRIVVQQTAFSLAEYLLKTYTKPSIVIAFDGRKNSDVFAVDTAEIMAAAGVETILFEKYQATPLLAYSVRKLNTSAGVMVTASHNPPNDNGYKLYLGGEDNGAQIIPPVDKNIASIIEEVANTTSISHIPKSSNYKIAPESIVSDYIDETSKLAKNTSNLKVIYTAMHGVGWNMVKNIVEKTGLAHIIPVTEQQDPDSTFHTVSFPNPEEDGALDLAFNLAIEHKADLIVANDPDADRLSVSIPTDNTKTTYRKLSGNETGLLLAWRAAEKAKKAGITKGTLACSVVSSPGLATIAKKYSFNHAETLTGFKWVARAPEIIYGYEEALGYLVNPDMLRDKDGISALTMMLDYAAELANNNTNLGEEIIRFNKTFGAFSSSQISIRFEDLDLISETINKLRNNFPSEIAGKKIVEFTDYNNASGNMKSNLIKAVLADESRIMIRPSGTEPKVKIYLDASCNNNIIAMQKCADDKIIAMKSAVEDLLASI